MDKEDLRMGIERLYAQNLGVKPGETVLAFTDRVGPEENVPHDQLEKRKDLLELFRLIVGMAPAGVNVKVVRVSGNDPYAVELESFLEKDLNYKNIAELGIGTNDRATRPDNILESDMYPGNKKKEFLIRGQLIDVNED